MLLTSMSGVATLASRDRREKRRGTPVAIGGAMRLLRTALLLALGTVSIGACADDEACGAESSSEDACIALEGPGQEASPWTLTMQTRRTFQATICFSADETEPRVELDMARPGQSVDATSRSLALCVGASDLVASRSFAPTRQNPALPVDDGKAVMHWQLRHRHCYVTEPSTAPGYGHGRTTIVCEDRDSTEYFADGGSIVCRGDAELISCDPSNATFVNPASGERARMRGWLHGAPPSRYADCPSETTGCPAEPDPALSAQNACMQSTGDVIHPTLAPPYIEGGAGFQGMGTCFQSAALPGSEDSCALGGDRLLRTDNRFQLCFPSADLREKRTYTLAGRAPNDVYGMPKDQAAFARYEGTAVYQGQLVSSDSRSWLATAGSITCGAESGGIVCRFDGVTFTDTTNGVTRTSTTSGWLHGGLPQ